MKKHYEPIEDLNEPCYICGENIKKDYYCIGENKEGKLLYRHRKCKPTGKIILKKE